MEDPHRANFERVGAADEPVGIGAFHFDIEQLGEPVVVAATEVIVVHDRHAQTIGRGLEDQLARIM